MSVGRRWWPRLLLGLGGVFLAYQLWLLAHVLWWRQHNPDSSAFMRAGLARLRSDDPDAQLHQHWVPYSAIAYPLKAAVLAAEDARFLRHHGFDWLGIEQAWNKDLAHHRIVAGGSTISQQLAKNLFLSERRTPWRKAEEGLITLMLEHLLSKRRILEIYLNVIEWGDGVYGADAAAEHYFHVHARHLNTAQACWLAAAIPDPRAADDHRRTRHLRRKAAILARRLTQVAVP